ncbi:MAG: alpha/beta fold hydrolase [Syntrophobacterales bacterium]|nr:alpha/beta fold hydrolase [Syntrophobacterales bacterium]
MMEQRVAISGPEVILEGRFQAGRGVGGVVVAHPHPLYGGSMDNNVVWTVRQAFGARGASTLRFNFRGVGGSTGTYGQGEGEVEDLRAALEYLVQHASAPYLVVGYSFGAAVAAQAFLRGLGGADAVLIAPPIALMRLDFLSQVPSLAGIVVGEWDDFCPLAALYGLMAGRPVPVPIAVVPQADHFFGGREEALFRLLRDFPLPGWPEASPRPEAAH